jgi:hypothetical protein
MTNGETLASGGGAGWEFVAELAAWIDSEMNR